MLKNNTAKRILFSIILLSIFIPTFLLNSYAGVPGRIIGLVIFTLVGILGTYEVIKAITTSKYRSLLFAFALNVSFVIWPFDGLETIMQNKEIAHSLASISHLLFDWKLIIISLLASILFLVSFPAMWKLENASTRVFMLLLISFLIPLFAKSIWTINLIGMGYLIFALCIPIISDTTAYFGGMLFGKKWFKGAKLAPKISPKKTWAGFVISVVLTILYTTIVGYFIGFWDGSSNELLLSIFAGISLSLVSPIGDLFFSWIKREVEIKDFSNLIPGHGGVFDRLDAMAFVFVFITLLLLTN